jgi:hypothetical protein
LTSSGSMNVIALSEVSMNSTSEEMETVTRSQHLFPQPSLCLPRACRGIHLRATAGITVSKPALRLPCPCRLRHPLRRCHSKRRICEVSMQPGPARASVVEPTPSSPPTFEAGGSAKASRMQIAAGSVNLAMLLAIAGQSGISTPVRTSTSGHSVALRSLAYLYNMINSQHGRSTLAVKDIRATILGSDLVVFSVSISAFLAGPSLERRHPDLWPGCRADS